MLLDVSRWKMEWQQVDKYLEGLKDLFSIGRMITFSIKFVSKASLGGFATVKGKKKTKSATKAQRLQRAAKVGLWTQAYKQYQRRANTAASISLLAG